MNRIFIQEDIFCMLAILFIVYRLEKQISSSTEDLFKYVKYLLVSCFFFFITDLSWVIISSDYFIAPPTIHFFVNAIYFLLLTSMSIFLNISFWAMKSTVPLNKKNLRKGLMFIALTLSLLLLMSYNTGLIFSIDKNSNYVKGPLFFLIPLISVCIITGTLIITLIHGFKSPNRKQRNNFFALAFITIIPMLACLISFFIPGRTVMNLSIVFTAFQISALLNEFLTTTDPLTKLYNRAFLYNFLLEEIKNYYNGKGDKEGFHVLMMDLNDFKTINDNYGHIEGDVALVRVATALRKACANKKCLIARQSGDEFVIVFNESDKEKVEALCKDIHKALKDENDIAKEEYIMEKAFIGKSNFSSPEAFYNLSISIGVAQYTAEMKTVEKLISTADEMLYQEKNLFHYRKKAINIG